MNNLLEKLVTGITRMLRHCVRYSGRPKMMPENTAEHNFWVAYYAWFIAEWWNRDNPDNPVDKNLCVTKGIFHDMEDIAGDVMHPMKYSSPTMLSSIKAFERETVYDYSNYINVPKMYEIWAQSKQGLAGQVIKLAEVYSVIGWCLDEIKLGNSIIKGTVADEFITAWEESGDFGFKYQWFEDRMTEAMTFCKQQFRGAKR